MVQPGHGSDEAAGAELWDQVLDHVSRVADQLGLSGWSLGVLADGRLHTYSRGFAPDTCARYARLDRDVRLPGPATVRTGRNQYFATKQDAHRLYPLAAGIDTDTVHEGAAALLLSSGEGAPLGYLALHFGSPRVFDVVERDRLERLAASVALSMPAPETTSAGTARGSSVRHEPVVAAVMRRRC